MLAVAEDFEQSLTVLAFGAAELFEVGQACGDGVAVGGGQGGGLRGGDGGLAGVAGLVRGVDECLQRRGDLGGPGDAGVGLGGVGEVAQEVDVMPISA